MALTWLSYVDRSYQQIKVAILKKIAVDVPEITDHSEGNPFVVLVSVWAGLTEMLGYYIDNHARETNILTCRLWKSAVLIANNRDYRIKCRVAASVDLIFQIPNATTERLLIPAYTLVKTYSNIEFRTIQDAYIEIGRNSVTVSARQIEFTDESYRAIAPFVPMFEMEISETDIAFNSVQVEVNGLLWQRVDTLAYSIATDLHYTQDVNASNNTVLRFGDGITGAIPQNDIVATYRKTRGLQGNCAANTINKIEGDLGIANLVTYNPNAASGGTNTQTIKDLQFSIPKALRTQYRCVTAQDFVDTALLCAGVNSAKVVFDCGKNIALYIAPVGGGIASNDLLLTVLKYIDDKRIITTKVDVFAAGEVRIKLNVSVKAKAHYRNNDVSQNVKDRLLEFLSYRKQSIGGQLEISDLYEIIESTKGVENSKIVEIQPLPYPRPANTIRPLLWQIYDMNVPRVMNWKVTMLDSNRFELLCNTQYIGTFQVNSRVNQNGFTFSIHPNQYETGAMWIFQTLPKQASFTLTEMSVISCLDSDITITVNGGIV